MRRLDKLTQCIIRFFNVSTKFRSEKLICSQKSSRWRSFTNLFCQAKHSFAYEIFLYFDTYSNANYILFL